MTTSSLVTTFTLSNPDDPADRLSVMLRDASPDDEGFVFSNWLQSHRQNGDWPRRISKGRYFDGHKRTVARILARSRCLVAENYDRPGQLLGFVCCEPPGALHWICVKQTFRGLGLARRMLVEVGMREPVTCTHWTLAAANIARRGAAWRYDPFAVRDHEDS